MKLNTQIKSGAVAAESDQFAQVRSLSGEQDQRFGIAIFGTAVSGIAWGGPTMILGLVKDVAHVKMGRVEFKG